MFSVACVYRLLLIWLACSCALAAKPYRFLLVVSDQWKDPASYVIEGGSDFAILAGLFKTWGLPFDVVRLDQQRLDKYHLLDRNGEPRYGTIIWSADPATLEGKDLGLIEVLVREYGVGLLALGDAVATPEISALTGLTYVSEYALIENPETVQEHFITRGLKGREQEFLGGGGRRRGDKVTVQGATVLAKRGSLPFLAVREFDKGGRVVWLDAHRPSGQIGRQIVRDLLKRCLVWTQGYALYAEYPKSVVLEMHDMGTSDKTFLPYWHYRTLSEEEIRKAIIEPLKRHKAVLTQVVNTGFVDRKSQRVLNPWEQTRVVDELDGKTIHDYASTKRGLDAGRREGVFEIQSHGWTHMLPDLDSPPGPFWNAPLDGIATLGFDTEFGDRMRSREIPAVTQELHMRRSIEYLREDFGVTPLFIRPGGGEHSQTLANHTGRIAAALGFGLTRLASPYYLGRDRVVALGPPVPQIGWAFDTKLSAADMPWTIDGPVFIAFHDRDVAMDKGAMDRLLNDLGGDVRYMTAGEYCAYLHSTVARDASPSESLTLSLTYDDHYCRHFDSHESTWTLHLSDELRSRLKLQQPEKQTVIVPRGLGRHILNVRAEGALVRRGS
jgi:peptidoglycan/xylan/chitin deacetylase (PgdA/CDA1 family)